MPTRVTVNTNNLNLPLQANTTYRIALDAGFVAEPANNKTGNPAINSLVTVTTANNGGALNPFARGNGEVDVVNNKNFVFSAANKTKAGPGTIKLYMVSLDNQPDTLMHTFNMSDTSRVTFQNGVGTGENAANFITLNLLGFLRADRAFYFIIDSNAVVSLDGLETQWFQGKQRSLKTVTVNGNTVENNNVVKWSNIPSIEMDGSGDYLSLPSQSDFTFGTKNWNIYFWIRLKTNTQTCTVYDQRPSATEGAYPTIRLQSGVLQYYTNGAVRITGPTLVANNWYFVRMSHNSTSSVLYVNGFRVGSEYTDNTVYAAGDVKIGISGYDLTGSLNGYLSDFEIQNIDGSNFQDNPGSNGALPTRPTIPTFNTVLLLNGVQDFVSNFFFDTQEETLGFPSISVQQPVQLLSVEQSGAATISTEQYKFDGTSGKIGLYRNVTVTATGSPTYTTGNFGNSITFNSNNYMQTQITVQGDFTYECFVRPSNIVGSKEIFRVLDSNNVFRYSLGISNAGLYTVSTNPEPGGGTTVGSARLTANTWHHVAWVRKNGAVKQYVDGRLNGDRGVEQNLTSANIFIGGSAIGGGMIGQIDEIRISNIARYDNFFSAPNTAFTNDGSTLLLLHLENNTIDDNSQMPGNDLFISHNNNFTSTSPVYPLANWGANTGFTCELWVRYQSLIGLDDSGPTTIGVMDRRDWPLTWAFGAVANSFGTAAYLRLLYLRNANVNDYHQITSSSAIILPNTWTHIAWAKDGSTIRLYINGVVVASGAFTTSNNAVRDFSIGSHYRTGAAAFVDEVRISNVARYGSNNFTPANSAFVRDNNTLLLIHDVHDDDNGVRGRSKLTAIPFSYPAKTISMSGAMVFTLNATSNILAFVNNLLSSRTFKTRQGNNIFSTNTPFIGDPDNSSTYGFSLNSDQGEFGTTTTASGTYTFSGTKTQVNAQFSNVVFYPNFNLNNSETVYYTINVSKNGTILQTQILALINQGLSNIAPQTNYYTTSQSIPITLEESKYFLFDMTIVGGGGGGGGFVSTSICGANCATGVPVGGENDFIVGAGGGGGQVIQISNHNPTTTGTINITIGSSGISGWESIYRNTANNLNQETFFNGTNGGSTTVVFPNETWTAAGGEGGSKASDDGIQGGGGRDGSLTYGAETYGVNNNHPAFPWSGGWLNAPSYNLPARNSGTTPNSQRVASGGGGAGGPPEFRYSVLSGFGEPWSGSGALFVYMGWGGKGIRSEIDNRMYGAGGAGGNNRIEQRWHPGTLEPNLALLPNIPYWVHREQTRDNQGYVDSDGPRRLYYNIPNNVDGGYGTQDSQNNFEKPLAQQSFGHGGVGMGRTLGYNSAQGPSQFGRYPMEFAIVDLNTGHVSTSGQGPNQPNYFYAKPGVVVMRRKIAP
jgi:hypothetical protein